MSVIRDLQQSGKKTGQSWLHLLAMLARYLNQTDAMSSPFARLGVPGWRWGQKASLTGVRNNLLPTHLSASHGPHRQLTITACEAVARANWRQIYKQPKIDIIGWKLSATAPQYAPKAHHARSRAVVCQSRPDRPPPCVQLKGRWRQIRHSLQRR